MWIPVLKVLAAIAVAVVLIRIASRKWFSSGSRGDRILRSLPGSLVQEIADRLDQPEELLMFLEKFFGCVYRGGEKPVGELCALENILPAPLPPEELADLSRTAGAIESDALLAYACPVPGCSRPAIVTVCRNGDLNGWLVGVFRPEQISGPET